MLVLQPMLSTDGPGTGQIEDFKARPCRSSVLSMPVRVPPAILFHELSFVLTTGMPH